MSSPGWRQRAAATPRGPGLLPPADWAPGARSPFGTGSSRAAPPTTGEGPATGRPPREVAGAAGPAHPARLGRAFGAWAHSEPEPVPPRGRYLDGFLQHRHPALPGLHLLLTEPGAGRTRPRLSACPGGPAWPSPGTFKLPATVTGAGDGERRNEASQEPNPPEAGDGNTRTLCRKYTKRQAEKAERWRATAGKPPRQPGGRASADGVARAGTEVPERWGMGERAAEKVTLENKVWTFVHLQEIALPRGKTDYGAKGCQSIEILGANFEPLSSDLVSSLPPVSPPPPTFRTAPHTHSTSGPWGAAGTSQPDHCLPPALCPPLTPLHPSPAAVVFTWNLQFKFVLISIPFRCSSAVLFFAAARVKQNGRGAWEQRAGWRWGGKNAN